MSRDNPNTALSALELCRSWTEWDGEAFAGTPVEAKFEKRQMCIGEGTEDARRMDGEIVSLRQVPGPHQQSHVLVEGIHGGNLA